MVLHGRMRNIALVAVLLALAAGPVPARALQPAAEWSRDAHAVRSSTNEGIVRSSTNSDGPRRFWVKDTHRYTSPWYDGARRKMIGYGCTRAPYYDPDPRCEDRRGFHHGLDMAMPCGTRLFAGFRGWVADPSSAGALGSAYGRKAFRVRNFDKGVDVVLGHVERVYVDPGDRVRKGQLIARAGKLGAPDGCHLHFEVRPVRGGYTTARRPHPYLMLQR